MPRRTTRLKYTRFYATFPPRARLVLDVQVIRFYATFTQRLASPRPIRFYATPRCGKCGVNPVADTYFRNAPCGVKCGVMFAHVSGQIGYRKGGV